MKTIDSIRKTSIWIFIVPLVVLNSCLFISVNYELFENTIFRVDQIGRSGFTIPYIDGSLSISRSARTYPAYILFKTGMILTGILLIQYWRANNELFKKINNEIKNKNFLKFGIGSAIFLIIHSVFLGVTFEENSFEMFENINKLLKRVVLLGFIIFEIIAQTFLVINLYKAKKEISEFINKKILTIKIVLVITLIVVALLTLPILNSSQYTHFKHALEWNYFLGIILFYLLTFLLWKKRETLVHTP